MSLSNAGDKMNQNSSLPNIDRPKNTTPIYDMDEVISHEGAEKVMDDDDDDFERFDVKKGLAAQTANMH